MLSAVTRPSVIIDVRVLISTLLGAEEASQEEEHSSRLGGQ